MATDIATGQGARKYSTFDADLELRAAAAAAITAVAGDFAAPDYESATIDLGPGVVYGRVVIQNFAETVNADNTSWSHIALVGVNAAATAQVELAAIRVGNNEMTLNTSDTATGEDDLDIVFCNAKFGAIWPKVKLVVVNEGTSHSIDFTAFITRLQ